MSHFGKVIYVTMSIRRKADTITQYPKSPGTNAQLQRATHSLELDVDALDNKLQA